MQLAKEDKLEEALYLWFIQKRSQGTAIIGPLLAEKASELHQKWNWTLSLQLARVGCGGSASVTE